MPLWAKIYWVVALALFGVWVWRRIRARNQKRADELSASDPAAPIASADPAGKAWPAPPPLDPRDTTYRLDPSEASESATRSEPVGEATAISDDWRAGSSGSVADGPVPRRTLPDLLAGITLPHELVPITQVDTSIDLATHVVVATRKASAEVVADGLTAELERLGYEIDRGSMTELTATGERGTVRVLIHPDGSTVHDAGLRRFPTTEENTVVVELFAG